MKKTPIISLTLIIILITPPAFAVNRVLSLDGNGDYVEITDIPTASAVGSLNAINSQVTMEAWIKVKAFTNQWMPIIYKGDKPTSSLDNGSYTLWLDCNYRRLLLASAPGSQMPIRLMSPTGSIALDTWYHVAGIIDGKNGVMKIFLNGSEVASGVFGKDIKVSSLPLRIGWTHEHFEQIPTLLFPPPIFPLSLVSHGLRRIFLILA